MEKLKLHTPDLTDANVARIAELFPNCITEAASEDGKIVRSIDFDLLRQELSKNIVEGPRERYQLTWPGKAEALLAANAPIAKTLRPCRDESVNFDTTKNIFIEGDNLDALKLLQETYLNKIKLIYIDPPYNTGSDFLYDDNFAQTNAEFFKSSNQQSEQGSRLVANTESNGRFHSDWLSMMYPRLRIAKSLLRRDGFIFISIDNHEVHNLKSICCEVFGQENFRNMIVVRRGVKNVQSQFDDISNLSSGHEYILCFSRDSTTRMPKLSHDIEGNQAGKWDTFWRGTDRQTMRYEFFGQKPETGQWRWSFDRAEAARKNYEQFLSGNASSMSLDDYFLEHRQSTNVELDFVRLNEENVVQYYVSPRDYKLISDNWMDVAIKGNVIGFDTEKHVSLMRRIIEWVTVENDTVLDFFAGSGTTGHAVYEINKDVQSSRRFILVQLPEPTPEKEFKDLAELTRRRLIKVGSELSADLAGLTLDIGFRTLRVADSNMREVYYRPDQVDTEDLLGQIDNIREDRTAEDLLFQVLLDWGVDLSLPIAKETIAEKSVYFVDETALAACFDTGVTEELVKKIAARKPLRVVFRDNGFASDSVKINVEQVFKLLSPSTDVKSI